MPTYDFECQKCLKEYSKLTDYDETGKYKTVSCPYCNSRKKRKLVGGCGEAPACVFTNPKDTSKWDSFTYRAGYLMDKATTERREAEAKSHMGTNPYSSKKLD
jgi:putative FmdB family regulatory protein